MTNLKVDANVRRADLYAELKALNSKSGHIEASAVMTRDGMSMASAHISEADPDRVSAMCASMLSLADTTAKELARGELRQVLVECDKGSVLLVHIGRKAVLAVTAKASNNLGMVFHEAKKAAQKIGEMLANAADLD